MKDTALQAPFDKHLSPTVPYVPQRRRTTSPRIEGISRFMTHPKIPARSNELFVAGTTTKQALEEAFREIAPVKNIKILKNYAFISFDDDANIEHIPGKYYDVGGKSVYIEYARGNDIRFIPTRLRNRANLWHNRKNKFK
ncbi:hypothetical protein KMI_12g18250 [Encephalitozoon hellem]|uniref:RNP domain-containing protein n=1 Tax=Encephalitozoon hellem TaxID=27973 RepID=A0ABY8CS41_ENCHE|nr:hypothetical protein KMI_12g18250 [Encephalitozoon hellem]WEL39807.1 RNP domain-containing protein [Encephalitozoon hellem]